MKNILSLLLLFVCLQLNAQTPEERLKEKGLTLPSVSKPIANYVNVVRVGNLLFLSGKGPLQADGTNIVGKVGKDLTLEQGYAAAQLVALHHIAVIKAEVGDLSKVKRIVKVLGLVQCEGNFYDQPKVINGYSDTMAAVFGEKGKHARSAIGAIALPGNICVEVEVVVEVE